MANTYTQLASDTFNSANENPLNATNWTTVSGSTALQIVSDACEASALSNLCRELYTGYNSNSWPKDQFSSATVAAVTSANSPAIRLFARASSSTGANTYQLLISAANLTWQLLQAGTSLSSGTIPTCSVGDTFMLAIVGTTVIALQNGTQLGTATNSTITSGTPGLGTQVTANLSDFGWKNFVGGAVNATDSITAGGTQSANTGATFATNLAVTVLDSLNNPLPGVSVVFTAPSSGASGTFATGGTNTQTVTTNASGVATASAFTANGAGGSYQVSAAVNGLSNLNFSLTNNSSGGISTVLAPAPIPATVANSSGYSWPITSPTLGNKLGQPTPVVFCDANGNELTVTGSTKGAFITGALPVVLCDSTGHPLAAPFVFTSNGNAITVSATLTGVKLGQPVPVVATDPNGFLYLLRASHSAAWQAIPQLSLSVT